VAAAEGGTALGVLDQWKLQKLLKEQKQEKEVDKYIEHSFRRNFLLNDREIELYEPPKVLGDVFEALMGAIFMDGGMTKVLEVYQHLLSPFILFVAKYSKNLNREAKDDFNGLCNRHKIKPAIFHTEVEIDSLPPFMQALGESAKTTLAPLPKTSYFTPSHQTRAQSTSMMG
jgi:dsRNA-specific ribonuclease